MLDSQKLDFHITFRNLLDFDPAWDMKGAEIDVYVARLLTATLDANTVRRDEAIRQWKDWLRKYAERINAEILEGLWGDTEKAKEERKESMRLVNPRFVLRQWLLEEVIRRVERDSTSGKRVLAKVLHVCDLFYFSRTLSTGVDRLSQMACNPYEAWGAEGEKRLEEELVKEEREERRFCGIGEKGMLGFQCSCSS